MSRTCYDGFECPWLIFWVKNSKNHFRVIWRHWPLMTRWFHDLISSLLSAKWMSESKSAPQITLEGSRTRKSRRRSFTSFDLSWPRLTCEDRMTCGMHGYYCNCHYCKLSATERIFRLTWPQLWRHTSNVRGVRILKFSGRRKKDDGKLWKKWWHSTGKQKRYSRKTAGGASTPPPRAGEG